MPLFDTTINGFEKALTNLTDGEIANSTVKVTVHMSDSSVVSISQAIFSLPERIQEPTVAGPPRCEYLKLV